MTKSDLVVRMATAAGWPKASTERAMRALLAGIRASLKHGDAVTLVGFGTFSVARRKPRTLKNPRTGQSVTVGGRARSEEHTSELQSQSNLVCRLLLEKKKKYDTKRVSYSSSHYTTILLVI